MPRPAPVPDHRPNGSETAPRRHRGGRGRRWSRPPWQRPRRPVHRSARPRGSRSSGRPRRWPSRAGRCRAPPAASTPCHRCACCTGPPWHPPARRRRSRTATAPTRPSRAAAQAATDRARLRSTRGARRGRCTVVAACWPAGPGAWRRHRAASAQAGRRTEEDLRTRDRPFGSPQTIRASGSPAARARSMAGKARRVLLQSDGLRSPIQRAAANGARGADHQNSQRPLQMTHTPSRPFVTAWAMTAVHSRAVRRYSSA
mmetsp:Transcript_21863/g.85657  ORF Transcript_21863/g.85657 Transcript_21863/m.85657 type:complete len:258 (+) Transcript_21863:2328-3101(+)